MTTPGPSSQPRLIPVEEFVADPAFIVPTISQDGTRIVYLAPHRGRRNVGARGVDRSHDGPVDGDGHGPELPAAAHLRGPPCAPIRSDSI